MNDYLLLLISMSVALLSGIGTKYFIERFRTDAVSIHFYNGVSAAAAVVVLILWNGRFRASPFTLVLGLVFGGVTTVQRIASMKALEAGPWSYTSVLSSLSTIIPTLSGVLFWGETVAAVQYLGIFLMLVCITLSVDRSGDAGKTSLRWMLYCAVLFFSTGIIGVLQKFHQNTPHASELGEFLIVALSVSALVSFVFAFRAKTPDTASLNPLCTPLPLLLMLGSGVGIAVNNQLNLYLSGVLDSAFMFPVVNGGGLMLTTLSAVLLFRERLSKKQWLGLFIGAVSVILLCNPF